MKIISGIFLGFVFLNFNAFAVWEGEFAQLKIVDYKGEAKTSGIHHRASTKQAWEDVNKAITELTGIKDPIVSPEYIEYRSGAQALLSSAVYAANFGDLDTIEPEIDSTTESPWINLVQPQTREETNCMAMARIRGRTQGCGDVWQEGLQANEVACLNGKNYVKCHLECIKKIHQRAIAYSNGFCEKVEAPSQEEPQVEQTPAGAQVQAPERKKPETFFQFLRRVFGNKKPKA